MAFEGDRTMKCLRCDEEAYVQIYDSYLCGYCAFRILGDTFSSIYRSQWLSIMKDDLRSDEMMRQLKLEKDKQ